MNFGQLATNITVFLAPFLPYLISAGEETAKEIGKKFGEATVEKAKSLWGKISKATKNDSKITGAAESLAENPDDEIFQVALAKLLTKHLETSPQLATELMNLMKEDQAIQKILVEKGSKVKNIYQRLSKTGVQETTISDSEAGIIIQEQ